MLLQKGVVVTDLKPEHGEERTCVLALRSAYKVTVDMCVNYMLVNCMSVTKALQVIDAYLH